MLLTVLFWIFVVLFIIGFVATLVVPVGYEQKPVSLGVKFLRVFLSIFYGFFLYLVYHSGII